MSSTASWFRRRAEQPRPTIALRSRLYRNAPRPYAAWGVSILGESASFIPDIPVIHRLPRPFFALATHRFVRPLDRGRKAVEARKRTEIPGKPPGSRFHSLYAARERSPQEMPMVLDTGNPGPQRPQVRSTGDASGPRRTVSKCETGRSPRDRRRRKPRRLNVSRMAEWHRTNGASGGWPKGQPPFALKRVENPPMLGCKARLSARALAHVP